MKSKKMMILAAISLCAFAFADGNAKIKMTLDEAKQMALQKNPTLETAKARIQSAMEGIKQAEAAFYPSLELNAGYARLRDQRTTRPERDFENTDRYSVGASINYTLFDAFQDQFKLLNAKYIHSTAVEAEHDARRILLKAVATAFYASKLAQDNMNIAKEDAEFNKVLLEDANKRHEVGMLKQSEVLNIVLQVQNADVAYVTAEKNWHIAIVALGALLAIDQEEIWNSYEFVSTEVGEYVHKPFEELYDYAVRHRPDLISIDSKINIAEEGIKAARRTWLPRVTLFADGDLMRTHSAHFNRHYDRDITYGASASWEVFNGGKTRAQIAQAEAELLAAVKERQELLIDIASEIRQNILTMESSAKLLKLQEGVYANACKIRDLVKEEYTEGTATITRLNEVQTDVTNAASARSAAAIQFQNSIEALKATTGEILEIGNGTEN